MDVALVLARLLLAAVFAVAGAAKLADLAGSRVAVAGFGVPQVAARPLGTLLPFAELAIAGLLLFSGTARVGAVGALSLLVLFSIAVSVSMARGRTPYCHCFGQLHSEPAGAKMLARNLVLAAIAGFVAFADDSGPGVTDLDGVEWLGVAGGLLVVVVLVGGVAAVVGLLRQNGRLLLRIETVEGALRAHGVDIPEPQTGPPAGLPVGEPAPDFSLPGLDGETATLSSLRSGGKPVVLFFTDPNCVPCRQLMPLVGEWQRSRADDLTMAVISRGTSDEVRVEASEHGLESVLVDDEDRVSEAYRARLTPGAVLIDREGRIATPVAAGNEAIASLVQHAGSPALEVFPGGAPSASEGDELPETAVRTLEGEELALGDVLGERGRVVLFWDPDCGFCQGMLDRLRSLESEQQVTRELLVLSRGAAQANRQQGLRSEIVIEEDGFGLAQAVRAPGTPSAFRVDGAGRVASPVAVGADAVLGLVGKAARRG